MRRLVFLAFVIGLAAIALRPLPPEGDPRTPLDLTAAPDALTGLKLRWMTMRPEACFAAFALSGIRVLRVPDRPSEAGCEVENAVRLAGAVRAAPSAPIVTCPLAAAWMLFERNVLQPEARRHFGTEVSAVRHLGSY